MLLGRVPPRAKLKLWSKSTDCPVDLTYWAILPSKSRKIPRLTVGFCGQTKSLPPLPPRFAPLVCPASSASWPSWRAHSRDDALVGGPVPMSEGLISPLTLSISLLGPRTTVSLELAVVVLCWLAALGSFSGSGVVGLPPTGGSGDTGLSPSPPEFAIAATAASKDLLAAGLVW